MASIINLAPTTESEAVTEMLSCIGENARTVPTDLSTATDVDILAAIKILRNTSREVQTVGWRFNTEFGYAVAPATTGFSWTDYDSTTVPLNIFRPPSGLAAWTISKTADQFQSAYGQHLDVIVRKARQYTVASAAVPVFYDRALNRDGFEDREFLFIDPTWLFDFEDMPESARWFITVSASRRFVQKTMGDQTLVGFTELDATVALRNLVRDQGKRETASLLDHPDAARVVGLRPSGSTVYTSRRTRPLR